MFKSGQKLLQKISYQIILSRIKNDAVRFSNFLLIFKPKSNGYAQTLSLCAEIKIICFADLRQVWRYFIKNINTE